MVHFISYTKTIIGEIIVFQYHALLKNIIFIVDLNLHLSSKKGFFELLDVEMKLSSTFHP
jgi:hypothetical protein